MAPKPEIDEEILFGIIAETQLIAARIPHLVTQWPTMNADDQRSFIQMFGEICFYMNQFRADTVVTNPKFLPVFDQLVASFVGHTPTVEKLASDAGLILNTKGN